MSLNLPISTAHNEKNKSVVACAMLKQHNETISKYIIEIVTDMYV